MAGTPLAGMCTLESCGSPFKMTDIFPPQIIGFGTVNHELHLKRRAAIAPIFSKRAIQESEPLIKEQAKLLVALLEESLVSCKPLSLETAFLAFSTDIIGLYAFNLNFNLMKDTEAAANWRKTIDSVAISTEALWLLGSFPGQSLSCWPFLEGWFDRYFPIYVVF